MASNLLDDPYIKAALAQRQQQEAIVKQQQQAYYNRLADIDKRRDDAILQATESVSKLPDFVKSGAGIQWELNAQRKRVERDAELAKIALAPESKGASEMISIIKGKYPDAELSPFENTDTYKQANERFGQIANKYRVADVLNQQLETLGQDLVKMKEAEAIGDMETAAALKEGARRYAITSLTQNLSNAVNPNAQQRDEFIRQAESLIDPALIASQGGSMRQILGTTISKLTSSSSKEKERNQAISDLTSTLVSSVGSNPEAWYQTAQKANKDYMTAKEKELREQVVKKIGIHHAELMGATRPIANDPLSQYMAKIAQTPKSGFGQNTGSFTLSTGAGSTVPMQSGTMQAGAIQPGTVSGGTMAPTSRPRTKFTVLLPQ
jgi:hypothetical protein